MTFIKEQFVVSCLDLPDCYDQDITGHKALRLAILMRAILDATGNAQGNSFITREAKRWIFDDSIDALITFEDTCDALEINKEQVRKSIDNVIKSGIVIKRDKGKTALNPVSVIVKLER